MPDAILLAMMRRGTPVPRRQPTVTQDYVLGVSGLSKIFLGQRPLYQGVNLVVKEGEIVVVIGESGIGKSVFLNLLVGLIDPTSGEIWYRFSDGAGGPGVNVPIHDLGENDMASIRKEVGIVFQESSLFDWMTVYENISLPMDSHPEVVDGWIEGFRAAPETMCERLSAAADHLPPRLGALYRICREGGPESQQALEEMLEESQDQIRSELIYASVLSLMAEVRLDVTSDREKLPSQLSGGMKRRVGIARTLALRPRALLYDEPTAGLDPVMGKGVANAILDLQVRKIVRTSIVVTHDKELYWTLRDGAPTRLIYLHRGRFIDEKGKPITDTLYPDENHPVAPAVDDPHSKGVELDRRDPMNFISEFTANGWNA